MFKVIDKGAKSHLPFSPAIEVGGFVYVSGQASVDAETGAIIEDSFEGEMKRSFDNLRAILKAADCDFSQVINIRAYVNHQADLAAYNDLYKQIFSAPFPTRTTTIGGLGTVLKFEVDCVAFKG
ncbi:MAG: RidA family protein [Kiritimatiellia bacterium]